MSAPSNTQAGPSRYRPSDLSLVLRRDLTAFVEASFAIVSPGTRYERNWHVEAMTHALTQVFNGEVRRLLITIPPRHLKTICTSVAFCAWGLGKDPRLKFLVASYGDALARDQARDFRAVVHDPLYRRVFPHAACALHDTELNYVTAQHGGRRAVSRGGAVTGFGADIIVIDDIMKADDCLSDIGRQQVKDFYENTLVSRLNDKRTGRIVVVQQRLHEDDLPAYLLEKGGFTQLSLPAIAPEPRTYALGHGNIKRVEPGEFLSPRERQAELDRIRIDLGAASFAAQYLQDPADGHADAFRWSSIRTYEEAPPREACELVVQSWDTAAKINPNNDYSACSTWGWHGGVWKLLDVIRGRYEYPDLYQLAHSHRRRWKARVLLIEETSSGVALAQHLRRDLLAERRPRQGGPWLVRSYTPKVGKAIRLATQVVRLEQGAYLFPKTAPFLEDLKREMVMFGHAKHDDQVDSITQFIAWSSNGKGHLMLKSMREKQARERR